MIFFQIKSPNSRISNAEFNIMFVQCAFSLNEDSNVETKSKVVVFSCNQFALFGLLELGEEVRNVLGLLVYRWIDIS